MEMFRVDTVDQAIKKVESSLVNTDLGFEHVFLLDSLDRVLAQDLCATHNVPEFDRSTVDGYALISKDVFGASESIPVLLDIIGQVEMGKSTDLILKSGQAAYVPTGAMLPRNADAVVMIEYVEKLDAESIAVYTSLAPKSGVMHRGEDLKNGEIVLRKGMHIRVQDIGMLAALGIKEVPVIKRPRISIFSTGDEVVEAFSENIALGQIRDINSYALAAYAEKLGAVVIERRILPDDYNSLFSAIEDSLKKSDLVILSGGSSVGTKDMTARVIADLGEPGVFTHGLAMKPGKPTIIGQARGKMIFGLPGHPSSSIMVFEAVVRPAIESLLGLGQKDKYSISAEIEANIHSAPGKRSYQMVSLSKRDGKCYATPVYAKSGAISLLSKASGYIVIDENTEGILKGSEVMVTVF